MFVLCAILLGAAAPGRNPHPTASPKRQERGLLSFWITLSRLTTFTDSKKALIKRLEKLTAPASSPLPLLN